MSVHHLWHDEVKELQDLISFLQTNCASKREDTACNVLAALLREEPGQAVIREFFGNGHSEAVDVIVRRQLNGCFPDIQLLASGSLIGIFELKFDADLTDLQSSGRYKASCPKVILLAPESRIKDFETGYSDCFHQFCSWGWLLDELERNFRSDDARDHSLHLGTVAHMKEFCKIMQNSTFKPFTSEQLKQPNSETRQHLIWLVREFLTQAISEDLIQAAGILNVSMDDDFYYGQYVMLDTQKVWIGFWAKAWNQHATSGPLWVDLPRPCLQQLSAGGNRIAYFTIGDRQFGYPLLTAANPAASSHEEVEHSLGRLRILKCAVHPK